MMNDRFLDPATLARVGNLELIARQVVEGFISGRHRSPYHGFSVEYADHRPYTAGDELRTLDWKVLARTDKYYVKLFEEETNLRAWIVVDASGSMGFGPRTIAGMGKAVSKDYRPGEVGTTGRLDKFSYAGYMAAALAYLLTRQNDAVGLAVFDKTLRHFLPPRSSPAHFRRMLDVLGESVASQDTGVAPVLHELAERIPRRGLVIILSDLIDDLDATMQALQHLRHRRHEVLLFHIMDPAERDFPFDRMCRFVDMEGPGQLVANPKALRAKYLDRIGQFLERLGRECHQNRISYHLAVTDEPYDRYLGHFLEKRARLG